MPHGPGSGTPLDKVPAMEAGRIAVFSPGRCDLPHSRRFFCAPLAGMWPRNKGSSANCVDRLLSVRARASAPCRLATLLRTRCIPRATGTRRRPGCGSPHPPHRNAGASDPALPEPTGSAGRASLDPPLRTAAGLACQRRGPLALTARNGRSPNQARGPWVQVCGGAPWSRKSPQDSCGVGCIRPGRGKG